MCKQLKCKGRELLAGCCGADPHNLLTSASSIQSEPFPHKQNKFYFTLAIKQLHNIPTSKNSEEINYFEVVFFSSKTGMKTLNFICDKFLTSRCSKQLKMRSLKTGFSAPYQMT